ncbi:MAG: T9SS type A sorting domain-containing protein [Flavobacteriales bacterium]|nr:T9SS type A sorting domain-containing protein [Flavobacteriales bacterium]
MLSVHPLRDKLKYLMILLFSLFQRAEAQNIYRSGYISGNETWAADTVFVTDTLFISSTGRLHIMPGTTILAGNNPIYSDGYFQASGTPENPIVFTHIDTTGLYDPDNDSGGWKGIWFINSDSTVRDTALFSHCVFSHAKPQPFRNGGALRFEGWQHADFFGCSFVRNVNALYPAGIWMVKFGSCIIDSCLFAGNRTNNEGGAVLIRADSVSITRSVFFYNKSFFGIPFVGAQGKFGAGQVGGGNPSASFSSLVADTSYALISGNIFAYNFSVSNVFSVGSKKADVYNNVFLGNIGGGLGTGSSNMQNEFKRVCFNTFVNNTQFAVRFHSDHIYFFSNLLWNNGMNILPAREMDGEFKPGGQKYFPNFFKNNIIKGGHPNDENTITEMPAFVYSPYFVQPGEHSDLFSDPPDTSLWRLYDFRPAEGSPSIDNGLAEMQYYPPIIQDFYGNPRFMGLSPDIGAAEFLDFSNLANHKTSAGWSVYPNPAKEDVYITDPAGAELYSIELSDFSGKVFLKKEFSPSEQYHFRMEDFTPGIYILRLQTSQGTITQKLLKL